VINRGLAAVAFVVILSSLALHLMNYFKNDAFFKAQKLSSSKKLWVFFIVGILFVVFCIAFGFTSVLYLSPLILAYPVYYFYQHQWLPRAILLAGLVCVTYSQMYLTQNDRFHALILWMSKHPERFNTKIVQAFDRKTLTSRQAYDAANILILHPDESLRDYKMGREFAQIALKKQTNTEFSKQIAYTLACAMMGEEKIENARSVASRYKIDELECAPMSFRKPASTVRQKKYKYYF
jgi:hypothetical protein